jgi:hypothetical protein
MHNQDLLDAQKQHLAGLLEAIQRCVYFLHASDASIEWPLTGKVLSERKSGEQADSFIKILAIFEKNGVITSIADWQLARTARNLAAHDYEINYAEAAEHFNALHTLKPGLFRAALNFVRYAAQELGVGPTSADFAGEFFAITNAI